MADQLEFDERRSRAVEAVYATPDVVEQRRATLRALDLRPGERVLDIGCGPGYLAAEMAEAVGSRGAVHGIDPSPSMLAIAARREHAPGSAPVSLGEGDATALTLADGMFDVVVSTQVYEYVADIAQALAEVRRVLVPGGRVLVLDTDWDSIVWRSGDDARMARVLRAWDEHLVHRDLPRRLPQLLREGGFELRTVAVIPVVNVGYKRETYSGGTIDMIAEFVSGRHGITAEQAAAWADDLRALGPNYFFSLNRYLFVGTTAPGV
jgi:SAM-dependent methyltransferase